MLEPTDLPRTVMEVNIGANENSKAPHKSY